MGNEISLPERTGVHGLQCLLCGERLELRYRNLGCEAAWQRWPFAFMVKTFQNCCGQDRSTVINRLKHLCFRLWAYWKFPLNNYTEILKFLKEVCWGLWFTKMEYFYPHFFLHFLLSTLYITSSLYWYLSHVRFSCLILKSKLPFIIYYSWLSTLHVLFHLIFSTILWGNYYSRFTDEETGNLPKDTKLVIGRAKFKTRSVWLKLMSSPLYFLDHCRVSSLVPDDVTPVLVMEEHWSKMSVCIEES